MTPQKQIEQLARSKLLGNRVDPVGFVDEILALASREGGIRCTFAANDALRFTISKEADFEVPVDRARGKLRMMCARLAKLCQENGQEFLPYGGEGIIEKATPPPGSVSAASTGDGEVRAGPRISVGVGDVLVAKVAPRRDRWKVCFKNTMSEHEFTIIPN